MRRILLMPALVVAAVVFAAGLVIGLAIMLVESVTREGDCSARRTNQSAALHQASEPGVRDGSQAAANAPASAPVRPRPALPDRPQDIGIASANTGDPRTDEARAWFREAFERFRRETDMPDERAQAVLGVLYDYQENRRLDDELSWQSFRTRPPWEHDAWLDDTMPWRRDISMEAQTRLRALLSSSEYDAWVETMGSRAWVTLRFHAPLG